MPVMHELALECGHMHMLASVAACSARLTEAEWSVLFSMHLSNMGWLSSSSLGLAACMGLPGCCLRTRAAEAAVTKRPSRSAAAPQNRAALQGFMVLVLNWPRAQIESRVVVLTEGSDAS